MLSRGLEGCKNLSSRFYFANFFCKEIGIVFLYIILMPGIKNVFFLLHFRCIFVPLQSQIPKNMADNNNTRRTSRQQPIDNNYAHVQPQATEIERAVLGPLMIDKDAYAVVWHIAVVESCETVEGQSRAWI